MSAAHERVHREIARGQHDGLVWRIVRRYERRLPRHGALELDDLVQAGRMAMLHAVTKWDPEKGAFSTIATWWIRQGCQRCLDNDSRTVRVPVHELERARTARQSVPGALRLDLPIGDTAGPTHLDMLADTTSADPETAAIRNQLDARLQVALAALPAREAHVVRGRMRGMQLVEVGANMANPQRGRVGVSRERVRQLEGTAIGHLRRAVGAVAA